MEYVRKIAAEEFSASVARTFSATDSPYGHVDVEGIVGAFRTALLAEAVDQARPLHALPPHAMVGVMRRFLGPIPARSTACETRRPPLAPLGGFCSKHTR